MTKILVIKYNFSKITAGTFAGIPWYFSVIFAPMLGKVVDYFGRRAILIVGSNILLIIAHLMSMFSPSCDQCHNEVFSLCLLSIGYSIYASTMWASIAFTVPQEIIGTAYGVTECV